MNTAEIAIRSIQHFLYCPHRWGLLEIDRAWAENAFVTKANLMHDRVHDPDRSYTLKGKKVYTSVSVCNDESAYNLYGVTDCIEATASSDGVAICGGTQKYRLCIVEYKPTKPKNGLWNPDDLMQVFAQKICVDFVFGGDCDASIYYADVKKRVSLPLKENFSEYDAQLKSVLKEMRYCLENGIIPPVRKNQNCGGCSLKDICMPAVNITGTTRSRIAAAGRKDL